MDARRARTRNESRAPADTGPDDAIRTEVGGEVLTPRSVEHVLDGALASGRDPDRTALEVQRDRLRQEVADFTATITAGRGDIPEIVTTFEDRPKKLRSIETQLARREEPDPAALRQVLA